MKNKYFTENLKLLKPTLEKFSWTHPFEHELLLGWIIASPHSGILNQTDPYGCGGLWRPHVAITAEAGSGKSTLLNLIYEMLNSIPQQKRAYKFESITEAGLRQAVGHDALPVILDEMDTNNYTEYEFQKIIKLLRLCSAGGEMIKGTPSGEELKFTAKFCALIAGINLPKFSEADESRFCVLELTKTKHTTPWKEMVPEINKILSKRTGQDFYEYFWPQTPETPPHIKRNHMLRLFRNMLLMINKLQEVADSRSAAQYGVLLGALLWWYEDDVLWEGQTERPFVSLKGRDKIDYVGPNWKPSANSPLADELVGKVLQYWKDKKGLEDGQQMSTNNDDAQECFEKLMEARVGVDGDNRAITLRRLLSEQWSNETRNKMLDNLGLKIVDGVLAVSVRGTELEKIYKLSPWDKAWGPALKRLSFAESGTAKFSGVVKKVVKLKGLKISEEIV